MLQCIRISSSLATLAAYQKAQPMTFVC